MFLRPTLLPENTEQRYLIGKNMEISFMNNKITNEVLVPTNGNRPELCDVFNPLFFISVVDSYSIKTYYSSIQSLIK